jgi:hypothetical protein
MTLRQEGGDIVMEGRGWGHGVGMVQWGAKGKADRGLSYQQILAYYYGGLSPVKVPEPGSIRVLLATGVQQVTVAPSGPVNVVGGPTGPGPVTITGGSSMTIVSAAQNAITPTLALSGVAVTPTAMPGKPAGFSFNLSHAANVGITYQQTGVTATGSVAPVPLGSGDQTLSWDPFAAGLPPATYDVALVADDGVSRVVSPSFRVTVGSAPPTSSASPAAAPRSKAEKTRVPPWVPVGIGAVLLVGLALAGVGLAVRRRRPPSSPSPPPWQPGG